MKIRIVKSLALPALLTICGVSLWAQAGGLADVTVTLGPLDAASAYVAADDDFATTTLQIVNIMTVIGPNTLGLPCYNCVTGIAAPNLGMLEPAGVIPRGGAPSQINVFLWDQSYTGSCTFTIEILDKSKAVVASTTPTFSFTAPTTILLGTALAIPGTAEAGMGRVQTIAVCGASTTKSGSLFLSRSSPDASAPEEYDHGGRAYGRVLAREGEAARLPVDAKGGDRVAPLIA